MNKIMFALFFVFTFANFKEGTCNRKGGQNTSQQGTNAEHKEKIHDKISYIAAVIDRKHSKFIDHLRSTRKHNLQSEAEIMEKISQHMLNVTKTILPDLRALIETNNNRQDSASKVNAHFAEDHVEPMLQAVFDEGKDQPTFYKSLRKRLAETAQAQIRWLFEHHNK